MILFDLTYSISTCKLTRALQTGKPRGRGMPFLMLALVLALMPGRAEAASIKVTWNPAQVRRGSVIMMTVQSPVRLMAAEAATGADRFPLFKMEDGMYAALVGVDVRIKSPSIPVDFALFPAKAVHPTK